ncbi:MAG TPA: class I SAM-dependent methyltransferase [Planktothrix sp.]
MDLRAILANPHVYRLWCAVIAQKRDLYVDEFVRPQSQHRILDIGCGPGDVLDYLPAVEYVGIDHNANYIKEAKSRFGKKGDFRCQDLTETVSLEPNSYDIVMANGLLHHLDDASSQQLLTSCKQALKPTGYLVTFDGCFRPRQSPLKRFLLKMDRGKFVRTEPEYLRLAEQAFPEVHSFIREDFYNPLVFPYTIIVMRAFASPLDSAAEAAVKLVTAKGR